MLAPGEPIPGALPFFGPDPDVIFLWCVPWKLKETGLQWSQRLPIQPTSLNDWAQTGYTGSGSFRLMKVATPMTSSAGQQP